MGEGITGEVITGEGIMGEGITLEGITLEGMTLGGMTLEGITLEEIMEEATMAAQWGMMLEEAVMMMMGEMMTAMTAVMGAQDSLVYLSLEWVSCLLGRCWSTLDPAPVEVHRSTKYRILI